MAYVLPLSGERLQALEAGGPLVEPTNKMRAKRRDIVLVQRGQEFTHIAVGTPAKGGVSLSEIRRFRRPLQFLEIPAVMPKRLLPHALRVFRTGGVLPPKTGKAVLDSIAYLMPELRSYVERPL